jgi:hypothetical protein
VTDVVVFVRPGATVLFPFATGSVVVFVLPRAVALLPREVLVAGVVFVCPGAVALRPCALATTGVVFVFPGAVALFPCETARVALGAPAVITAAGNAGRRSDAEGGRGLGRVGSAGGP